MPRTDDAGVLVENVEIPASIVGQGHAVYTLKDPRTNVYRYVGVTTRWKCRKQNHMSMRSARHGSRLAKWFDDMRDAGVEPVFEIQSLCIGNFSDLAARRTERAIIRHLARDDESGDLLCNEADNPRLAGLKRWPN